ncbi:response regulator transcription factor [Tsukamurella sp. 8F]|uniref:response regulator transcription factor n=1 Tax=unclassified Tsukamurella TaxID=2633480 RepID=UPI0023B93E49|nr:MULTISPECIES: response regulator transcription factor [unclassified Tsukamurella]MDF0528565.1 response regulator transcription factor [Tsukamurella sp. 8J]MDF0585527.1 response regulator transcription factor [Tsukamurella sp. 8F]
MRIVLAEDSVLLREGLVRILERAGHDVVAAVGDAAALADSVAADAPDLVVTDVRMPARAGADEGALDEGLRAALALRRGTAGVPVLVLSQYVAGAYARELVESGGGVGYLLKERVGRVADFLRAADTVASGGVVVDPEVVTQMFRSSPLDRFTPREREVMERMARGDGNAQIAADLVVSDAAVSKHVASVFAKLDLPPEEGNRRVRAVLAYLAEHPT